jgi:hypothetical protein
MTTRLDGEDETAHVDANVLDTLQVCNGTARAPEATEQVLLIARWTPPLSTSLLTIMTTSSGA